jgi:hypothetical protein
MARPHPLIRVRAAALGPRGYWGRRQAPLIGDQSPKDCAWFGAGGEAILQALRAGSKGMRQSLWSGPASITLAAFNRRTVDLWGVGERWLLPDERSNSDMFAWLGWVQYQTQPLALGDTTGECSSPLAKIVWYYHTHLAPQLSAVRWTQGSQRMVSSDTHLTTIISGSVIPKLILLAVSKGVQSRN